MQADNHDTNTAVKYNANTADNHKHNSVVKHKTPLCIVVDQVLDPEQELYCIILDIAKPEKNNATHKESSKQPQCNTMTEYLSARPSSISTKIKFDIVK